MVEKKVALRKLNVPQVEEANLDTPGRTLKWAQPVCTVCQHGKVRDDWYKRCSHDPYFSKTRVKHVEEPELKETFEGSNVFEIVGEGKEWYEYQKTLNTTQVPYNIRIDGRKGVQMAEAGGYRPVQEFGVAPFCEYRGCWSQDLKVRHPQYGSYCSEWHAKLVVADMLGMVIQQDPDRLAEQLAKISIT